jgi:hypothetical protein
MHHPRTKLATTLDRVLTGARRAYAERVRRQLTASRFGLLAVAAAIALIPIDLLRVGGVTDNHVASADALRRVAFIPRQEPTADAWEHADLRWRNDTAAMQMFRPGYMFWQHIFTIPDGAVAFGSATDGRLLAVFPTRGDWTTRGVWADPSLADLLRDITLPADLDARRELVARLLESAVGPVLHNFTRGLSVTPNARRYGAFLDEWAAIYERFGVPGNLGLAQAVLESGLNGTRRSEAGAVGLCQWLETNWKVLDRLSPHRIEAHNQTTQAAYCAAYLTILATRHGSFIPALSEHHSGGTNVARTLVNGERLGGDDVREQYFLGAQLARDLRLLTVDTYRDLYRSYGPRSYRYAEMTFGNTFTVASLRASIPQVKVHAVRTSRALTLAELVRGTGLAEDEIRRFNPALVKRVPAGATLYLPTDGRAWGEDVAFWHRPAGDAYVDVLNEFIRLDAAGNQWADRAFASVLQQFRRAFQETNTEEGTVMATVLAYAIQDMYTSGRGAIVRDFRTSDHIRQLFELGVREREAALGQAGDAVVTE